MTLRAEMTADAPAGGAVEILLPASDDARPAQTRIASPVPVPLRHVGHDDLPRVTGCLAPRHART